MRESREEQVLGSEGARTEVVVLVVHDEELVHCGWRLVLARQEWVTRCVAGRSTIETIHLIDRYAPDVVVLDLDAGLPQVAADIAAIRKSAPNIAVLLVASGTTIAPRAARRIGASGVVGRTAPARDLAAAVRAVASGQTVFLAAGSPLTAGLSDRELEVLTHMSQGATNREIASSLVVSSETIKRHAANIFRKLEVRNRTEAAQRGRELGLVPAAGHRRAVRELSVA